jgi:hypothetical protein
MTFQPRFLRQTDIRRSAIIALGLTAFLAILRPFDINPQGLQGWLALLGLAPVNFALLLMAHQVPASVLGLERRIWIFPAVLAGNAAYVSLISGLEAPGLWLWQILAVGAIVLGAVTIFTRLETYRVELGALREGSGEPAERKPIRLTSETGGDVVQLRPNQILSLRAEANYVEIVWREESGIKSKFLRNTLTELLEQAGAEVLTRVHRSWAVNLDQAITVSGTSHRLEIDCGDAVRVPVSRAYVPQVQQTVKDRKPV